MDNMIQLILDNNCDTIIVLLGGDISNTGNEDEYNIAYDYFKEFKEELLKRKVETIFLSVPGNHDLQYKEGYVRERYEIIQLNQKEMTKQFGKETRKFDNYYEFEKCLLKLNSSNAASLVEENNCDRYLSQYTIEVHNHKFDIFALNNAMYSYFDPYEKFMDNEKGIFQILHDKITNIIRKSPFSLLLMHFPIEYFSDESRNLFFQTTRRNIDIILTGHIHEDYSSSLLANNRDLCVIQTGAFNTNRDDRSSFTILNIAASKSYYIQYTWDDKFKCYKKINKKIIDLIPYNFVLDEMEFNQDYI